MAAIPFDRPRLSRTLRDKGRFTPEQAEALAEALDHDVVRSNRSNDRDVIDFNETEHDVVRKPVPTSRNHALGDASRGNLATKTDVEALRSSVKADMTELKADILKGSDDDGRDRQAPCHE